MPDTVASGHLKWILFKLLSKRLEKGPVHFPHGYKTHLFRGPIENHFQSGDVQQSDVCFVRLQA